MGELQVNVYDLPFYGAIFGAVIGLVPLLLGIFKRKWLNGLIAFVASTISGTILALFSIPVVIAFTWFILDTQRSRKFLGLILIILGLFLSGFGLINLGFFSTPIDESFNYQNVTALYSVLAGVIIVVTGIVVTIIGYISKANDRTI